MEITECHHRDNCDKFHPFEEAVFGRKNVLIKVNYISHVRGKSERIWDEFKDQADANRRFLHFENPD